MKFRRIATYVLASALLSASLTACATDGRSGGGINKSDIGTIGGAIGGAWLGSNVGKGKGNIAAIAAGTLLGAALGNSVGASLDRADMAYYSNVSQDTMENTQTGRQVAWRNPDSGTSGTITPTRTFQEGGSYCREYQQTLNVGGKTQSGYGTACRQPDGSWKIVQ